MEFPKFLRLAYIQYYNSVKINDTTTIEEKVFDFHELIFAKLISQKLGFSYDLVEPSDRAWGSPDSNGNWSGMVGLLQRNEADLVMFVLSITKERQQVIDFSYPYYIQSLVFATRHLEPIIHQDSFLKPFTLDVWICLWTFLFILPAVYSMLFQRRFSCHHFTKAYRYFLLQPDSAPRTTAECVLRTFQLTLKTILGWSYAAVLLSFLTFPSLAGVRNIPDLANAVRDGKYMCTMFPGSSYAELLSESDDDNFRTIGQSLKENPGFEDFDVALKDTKLVKKPAYVSTEGMFTAVHSKYFVSEDGIFPDYRAVGVRKEFCCRSQLDSAIHEIWASGIYFKLIEDYEHKKAYKKGVWKYTDDEKNKKERSLSVTDMQGIFFILAAGYAVATAALLGEILLWKITKKKLNSSRN